MARNSYSAEFQTKLVLELLQGDKDVNALATQHNLNPGQIRSWKKDFWKTQTRFFKEISKPNFHRSKTGTQADERHGNRRTLPKSEPLETQLQRKYCSLFTEKCSDF